MARLVGCGLDVAAVAVFVAIGRSAHRHGLSAAGFVSTAWPFAAGLGTGWIVGEVVRRRLSTRPGRRDGADLATGVVVWLATVAVGMALRVVGGQGTAVSFTIVALVFLGAFILGWRTGVRVVRRRSATT